MQLWKGHIEISKIASSEKRNDVERVYQVSIAKSVGIGEMTQTIKVIKPSEVGRAGTEAAKRHIVTAGIETGDLI